jgi:hypothetical protein
MYERFYVIRYCGFEWKIKLYCGQALRFLIPSGLGSGFVICWKRTEAVERSGSGEKGWLGSILAERVTRDIVWRNFWRNMNRELRHFLSRMKMRRWK